MNAVPAAPLAALRAAGANRAASQEALAGRCKLHPTYISQLERGLKSPTLRVFRGLAQALGTSGAELLRKAEGAA